MSRKPAYFEDMRARAAGRWVQLEQDPELAGPWHQLFKQVQSPRHVVSELLQNGSWIEKVSGGHSFPWERRSASGELLQCYWDKEHCIHRDALQLDADVWKLCDQDPDKYTLLLIDADDAPLEITGRRLREMCDGGELTLYPAKYRLVHGNGTQRGGEAQ